MDLAELRRWFYHYSNEVRIPDSSATQLDVTDLLGQAYRMYARKTKCFRRDYALAATVDLATYAFEAFGQEAAATGSITVLEAANNTNALTLVSAQPAHTTIDRHYVTVSLKNNTGGQSSGNASTFTVVGTKHGGIAYTEVLTFATADLATKANQAVVTKTTRKPFASMTSITPSAAQPANWQRSAGVAAQSAGTRLFEISLVAFDSKPLRFKSVSQMDAERGAANRSDTWRWTDSGQVLYWVPWEEQTFRLWRTPDAASSIYLEGWETPDADYFAEDTDTPDIDESDQLLIPMYAAMIPQLRDAKSELKLSLTVFGPQVIAGWKAARKRIHGSVSESLVFGRYGGAGSVEKWWLPDSITNL
jgi:hypothetical protein